MSAELVPGMGSIMGDRRRSQANATCFALCLMRVCDFVEHLAGDLACSQRKPGYEAIPWLSQ